MQPCAAEPNPPGRRKFLGERVQVAGWRCPWLRDVEPAMGGEKGVHARREQLPFRWEWLQVEA